MQRDALDQVTTSIRSPDHPIEPVFVERWSPRAFDGSSISKAQLFTLFEAARWAPSAFNAQPWRFLYALRDEDNWPKFLDLLLPFNQTWAQHASALIFVVSDTLIESKPGAEPAPSRSHSFDAGAAWLLLALQATALSLHSHGMGGVDFARARSVLNVPERFSIEVAIAVGRMGDKGVLPEALQAQESPSLRRSISDIAFSGCFPSPE